MWLVSWVTMTLSFVCKVNTMSHFNNESPHRPYHLIYAWLWGQNKNFRAYWDFPPCFHFKHFNESEQKESKEKKIETLWELPKYNMETLGKLLKNFVNRLPQCRVAKSLQPKKYSICKVKWSTIKAQLSSLFHIFCFSFQKCQTLCSSQNSLHCFNFHFSAPALPSSDDSRLAVAPNTHSCLVFLSFRA